MRTLITLALAVTPSLALAQAGGEGDLLPASAFDAWLKKCTPTAKRGPIKTVGHLPDGSVQGVLANGKKVLFAAHSGDDCGRVFPIEKASARLRGKFDASGKVFKAFTMVQSDGECPGEDEGGCQQLLVLKHRDGHYASTTHLGACPKVELKAVKLFGKALDAVEVRCSSPGGGDMHAHSAAVYALQYPQLRKVLDVKLGYSSSAEGTAETEKRPDNGARCVYQPPGGYTVERVGEKPVVVVREASFDDPAAALQQTRRVWDGKAFVADGKPKALKGTSKIVCHDP